MKFFSLLVLILAITKVNVSLASCGRESDNPSNHGVIEFTITLPAATQMETPPTFCIPQDTFERTCNHDMLLGELFNFFLQNKEIADYLVSKGFTAADFLAPMSADQNHGTTSINTFRPLECSPTEPILVTVSSDLTPTFNITYNADKTTIESFSRNIDAPRIQNIEALFFMSGPTEEAA